MDEQEKRLVIERLWEKWNAPLSQYDEKRHGYVERVPGWAEDDAGW